jgi:predicted XRE-type DNA-binding protein
MSTSKRVGRTKRPAAQRSAGSTARPRAVRERVYEGTTHVTPADGNVFADLGFPPAEAENLLLRSELMTALMRIIERRRLTQTQAAKLFAVTQPRISDLNRDKIDRFTLDALVNMLAHAGVKVRLVIGRSAV